VATRTTPLLADAVAAYLDDRLHLDDVAENTLTHERNLLARFVMLTADKQVGRLTHGDVEAFIKALRSGDPRAGGKTGYSTASLNLAKIRLRGFLAWCYRKGFCRGDLQDALKASRKPEQRRDFLRLSANELLTMLDNATIPRDRAMLAAGMNTGLRSDELKNLRLGQFDLDNGEFYVKINKTNTSDVMPITSDFDAELRRWLSFYESECGPLQPSWYMFPSVTAPRFTAGNNDPSAQERKIVPTLRFSQPRSCVRRGLKSLGYSDEQLKGEGFHTLRRSVARLYFDSLVGSGYDYALRETAALLHHKNTSTTERYLGLDVEKVRRDERMKGKPFLTGMVSTPALRKAE
jgi:integrase